MLVKYRQRCKRIILLLPLACCVTLLVEVISHSVCRFMFWPDLKTHTRNSSSTVRLLLVADPHILGYRENPWFVVRWDLDRFLRLSFNYAKDFSNADVIVFLGDIFDELYSARSVDLNQTIGRFHDIYGSGDQKKIYLPGDNDIGGESLEVISDHSLWRFFRIFKSAADVETIKFVRIYKIPFYSPEEQLDAMAEKVRGPVSDDVLYNLAVTHASVMVDTHRPYHYAQDILDKLNCSLIICAHKHNSTYSMLDTKEADYSKRVQTQPMGSDRTALHFNLRQPHKDGILHEIVVPAATYRQEGFMPATGFGLLSIDLSGHAQYHVLWLPHREMMLIVTVLLLLFISIFYYKFYTKF